MNCGHIEIKYNSQRQNFKILNLFIISQVGDLAIEKIPPANSYMDCGPYSMWEYAAIASISRYKPKTVVET
jgi:hypothetical protein